MQSHAAQARAELLQRRPALRSEEFIAARSRAGKALGNLGDFLSLMTLAARLVRLIDGCRRQRLDGSHRDLTGGRYGFGRSLRHRLRSCTGSFSPTLALLAPTLLAVLGPAIGQPSVPLLPLASLLPAELAAVALQRVVGPETLPAAFQEASPPSRPISPGRVSLDLKSWRLPLIL